MEKGQKKWIWMPEQKLEIVHKHIDEHRSAKKFEKEYEVDHSTICRWTKKFLAATEKAFGRKVRPCN